MRGDKELNLNLHGCQDLLNRDASVFNLLDSLCFYLRKHSELLLDVLLTVMLASPEFLQPISIHE
jgi:hypothetical protein